MLWSNCKNREFSKIRTVNRIVCLSLLSRPCCSIARFSVCWPAYFGAYLLLCPSTSCSSVISSVEIWSGRSLCEKINWRGDPGRDHNRIDESSEYSGAGAILSILTARYNRILLTSQWSTRELSRALTDKRHLCQHGTWYMRLHIVGTATYVTSVVGLDSQSLVE